MKTFFLLLVTPIAFATTSLPRQIACEVPGAQSVVIHTDSLRMDLEWTHFLYLKIQQGLKLPKRPLDGHNMGFSSPELGSEKFYCTGQAEDFTCEISEGVEVLFPGQSVFGADLITVRHVRVRQHETETNFHFAVENGELKTEAEVVFSSKQCTVYK